MCSIRRGGKSASSPDVFFCCCCCRVISFLADLFLSFSHLRRALERRRCLPPPCDMICLLPPSLSLSQSDAVRLFDTCRPFPSVTGTFKSFFLSFFLFFLSFFSFISVGNLQTCFAFGFLFARPVFVGGGGEKRRNDGRPAASTNGRPHTTTLFLPSFFPSFLLWSWPYLSFFSAFD